tara:strand:- start:11761 stop:12873 length:1113 start_codon:yes stop_codon:yes gene_type:complete
MNAVFNNYAEHPGEFIREELEARNWSQRDLAYILGVPEQSVSQIVSGRRGISAEMAKALGDAFGTSAELFANLQKAWELAKAKAPDPAIARRGRVLSKYPLREMIQRGWIMDSTPELLEMQLCRFFEVRSFDEVPHMLPHAAKKTNYDEVPSTQLAWLYRVRHIAREMVTPSYSPEALRRALNEMSELKTSPEQTRHVPRLLHEAGVRYVIVESLPGAKIDGVCTWIGDAPVIGMSLRFSRIDNFWFVLRHECAHVLHGHGKTAPVIDVELEKQDANSEEEVLANAEASEFCIDQIKMKSFIIRKNPYFSEKDLLAFSKRTRTHPGIIAGQIQRHTQRWELFRKHQVSVKESVASTAILDGWGDVVPVDL